MPAERRAGMDQDHYGYSAIRDRPPLVWPGGKPLAVWLVIHLDLWEIVPPADSHRAPGAQGMWGSFFPDFRTYSYREYGLRIGIFRILDLLARHGLRATVAVDAAVCRRQPELIRTCLAAGHAIAAHGSHATRMITSRMDEAEERAFIGESLSAVREAAGITPRGWFGQDQGESTRTPRLLAEAGLAYVADWPNDEQPYLMGTAPPIVSLPIQFEFDDVQMLWMRQIETWRYPGFIREAAERLAVDGRAGGRLLGLGIRPWLFGRPHRIRYLDETLTALGSRDDIWHATADEIVDAFRASAEAPMPSPERTPA